MAYGLHIYGGNDIFIHASSISGALGYTGAGIAIDGGSRISMLSVSSPSWKIGTGVDQSAWLATNKP
jgi:hypothetical protein